MASSKWALGWVRAGVGAFAHGRKFGGSRPGQRLSVRHPLPLTNTPAAVFFCLCPVALRPRPTRHMASTSSWNMRQVEALIRCSNDSIFSLFMRHRGAPRGEVPLLPPSPCHSSHFPSGVPTRYPFPGHHDELQSCHINLALRS